MGQPSTSRSVTVAEKVPALGTLGRCLTYLRATDPRKAEVQLHSNK